MHDQLQKNSFLVVGRAGLDLYADPPGTEIENAASFSAALGGSAANIAVAIARQGGATALLTAVSDDTIGRFTLKALKGYGVDTRYIKSVGGELRNSLAIVETRPENCQSVIYRNDAADFHVTETDTQEIDYSAFAALIVTGTSLARQPSRGATMLALQLAREAGLVLVIDIDYRPYSWVSKTEAQQVCLKAAKMCDIIVANDVEFDVLSGGHQGLELAEQLAQSSGRIVVFKRGDKGCTTFADGKRIETPIFPVKALKPTGAGDGFLGGFMTGLVDGDDVQEAVRRGAATAAIVVTKVGCAPAMPDGDAVDAFMKMAKN